MNVNAVNAYFLTAKCCVRWSRRQTTYCTPDMCAALKTVKSHLILILIRIHFRINPLIFIDRPPCVCVCVRGGRIISLLSNPLGK